MVGKVSNISQGFRSISPRNDQEETPKATFDGRLRVLTWNILAPCYVKPPPPSWVDHSSMADWFIYSDWEYREHHIIELLKECQADLVCLQEVQVTESVWTCLETKLDEIGFQSYVQDSKGHPVANVILIAKRIGLNLLFQESRSRAFMLVLQPFGNEYPPLFVVNVHLQASRCAAETQQMKDAQTRFSQIQSLLKRVNLAWQNIRRQMYSSKGCDPAFLQEPYLMVMGDFNLSPEEPLYALMIKGQWPEDCKGLLPARVSELSASSLPLLPLRDIRGEELSSVMSCTYAATQRILDYIFVSENIEAVEHHSYAPSILLKNSTITRNAEKASSDTASDTPHLLWPNEYHPSDHIPVGATLQMVHHHHKDNE